LEEEKARQEAEAAKNKGSAPSATEGSSSQAQTSDMAVDSGVGDDGDDAELQAALAMSMGGAQDEDVDMNELSEEEQIKRAIELSMGGGGSEQQV
jgi:26S proteasome regulatory subunit N10